MASIHGLYHYVRAGGCRGGFVSGKCSSRAQTEKTTDVHCNARVEPSHCPFIDRTSVCSTFMWVP